LRAFELNGFFVFLENDKTDLRQIFQDLGENTCSLQPALKNTAPGPNGDRFMSPQSVNVGKMFDLSNHDVA